MNFLKKILSYFSSLNKIYKLIILGIVAFLFIVLFVLIWYNSSLKPVSKDNINIQVDIPIGSTSDDIANILKEKDIIKNKLNFKIYIKLNKISGLQAGNYILNKSWGVPEILETLKTGKVMKEQVIITFVEGKNIRWIANKIAEYTNNTTDDVYNLLKDKSYISSLINEYNFITEDITNENIYYPLEGYLFPDTYYFDGKDVSVKEIFKSMLDKMESVLNDIEKSESKLNVHELLTLASIVELEGTNVDSRKNIASVFYNRLENNMSLGSDVTTYYAYGIDMGDRDLTAEELYSYNPYNTRGPQMEGKLPVGPIASPSLSSIQAAAKPNNTDYLYFVADKNKKVYFTETITEHNNIITELKNNNLWYVY